MRMEERASFLLLGARAGKAACSAERGDSTERNALLSGCRALAGGNCLRTWFREELIQNGRCRWPRRQLELFEQPLEATQSGGRPTLQLLDHAGKRELAQVDPQ